jgi:hypothetical protein
MASGVKSSLAVNIRSHEEKGARHAKSARDRSFPFPSIKTDVKNGTLFIQVGPLTRRVVVEGGNRVAGDACNIRQEEERRADVDNKLAQFEAARNNPCRAINGVGGAPDRFPYTDIPRLPWVPDERGT